MFLLGQWRNYDDLEECLTIDELTTTYAAILGKENDRMMFQAKIAGAEIQGEQSQEKSGGLAAYMEEREQEMRQNKAVSGQKVDFGQGLGYRVIGG